MSEQKSNFCTQHVVNLYFSGDLMNTLLSYCGLMDSRMRVSEKDLPVIPQQKSTINFCAQHVVNLYFSGNSMNNLLSYWGLTEPRIRASEKDLPVI